MMRLLTYLLTDAVHVFTTVGAGTGGTHITYQISRLGEVNYQLTSIPYLQVRANLGRDGGIRCAHHKLAYHGCGLITKVNISAHLTGTKDHQSHKPAKPSLSSITQLQLPGEKSPQLLIQSILILWKRNFILQNFSCQQIALSRDAPFKYNYLFI